MSEESKRKHKKNKTDDEREHKKKKKDKREKQPKLHQLVGYTNAENPFGDHNLNQQFVWKKKLEKDGVKEEKKLSKQKKDEKDLHFYEEIQKVRNRRSEREAEQEEQERLRAEEARLREAEQYADWHQKEETFHLEQAKVRSKIRLVEGREKPIDILAKNIILITGEGQEEESKSKKVADISSLEIELRKPDTIFEGLDLNELKELQQDIQTYRELENGRELNEQTQNGDVDGEIDAFWNNLNIVCQYEIEQLLKIENNEDKSNVVHSSVLEELTSSFIEKTSYELVKIQNDIYLKLDQNDGTLDVEFWDEVLEQLVVFKAKADLKEFHSKLLKKWLLIIERKKETVRQYQEANPIEKSISDNNQSSSSSSSSSITTTTTLDSSEEAHRMVLAEKAKGMDDLEEELGLKDEVGTNNTYWWEDKYRPRKPRYFNRVKTGYDWNKYNQTHYDHDNPPPKTVQGYKFTLFYPDLIDRTIAPRYICEPSDSKEFMILRFTAGAPYEDIAFKLVNREWELGRKSGFRATFERGVMSLFFNFKRHFYRK